MYVAGKLYLNYIGSIMLLLDKMKTKWLFLDTSFISAYCYYKIDNNPYFTRIKKQQEYDKVIEAILPEFPNIEDDYKTIENCFSIIEYCGLGKLYLETCEANQAEFMQCFQLVNIDYMFAKYGETVILVRYLHELFNQVLEKSAIFFFEKINLEKIVKQFDEKRRKYRCHERGCFIEKMVDDWIEPLRKLDRGHVNFRELCGWLSWDALLRHEWTDKLSEKKSIIRLLAGFYLGARKHDNVPGAVLFGNLVNERLFRAKQELLDAYMLEFACMGYLPPDSNQREAVTIITADKGLKDKLINYIRGAMLLKGELIKEGLINRSILKDRAFDFMPGCLIIVGRKNPSAKPVVVDISNLIAG